MKITFVLLILVNFSCANSKSISDGGIGLMSSSKSLKFPKFKVRKIDSLGHVYLIYAEKTGQLYKIVSRKTDSLNCRNIKVDGEYGLWIESLFPPMVSGKGDTLWKRLDLVNAVEYNGTIIGTEAGCVNDLFRANNVVGLCIKY